MSNNVELQVGDDSVKAVVAHPGDTVIITGEIDVTWEQLEKLIDYLKSREVGCVVLDTGTQLRDSRT